jgi:hypothetical protein
MKYVKMLGLAAVVAAALMAVVGAGTASATVVCKTSTSPCTSKMAVGEEITASLKSSTAKLEAGFAEINCTTSTIAGKITNAGGSGVEVQGNVTGLTFGGCGTATVTVKESGGVKAKLGLTYTSGVNGSLKVTELVGVAVKVGSTECTYGGEISSGLSANGSTSPTTNATEVASAAPIPKTAGGILCANPSKWTAEYNVTSPSPLYAEAS